MTMPLWIAAWPRRSPNSRVWHVMKSTPGSLTTTRTRPWPPKLARAGSLGGFVLVTLVAACGSVPLLADDPPTKQSPVTQLVESLIAPYQTSGDSAPSLALGDASTDPLDSKSVKMIRSGCVCMTRTDPK